MQTLLITRAMPEAGTGIKANNRVRSFKMRGNWWSLGGSNP